MDPDDGGSVSTASRRAEGKGVVAVASAAALKQCRILWSAGAPLSPLDRVLRQMIDGASWAFCRRLVEGGKVSIGGVQVLDSRVLVPPNTEIEVNPRVARPGPRGAAEVRLVYHDAQIVVADKPSGISTVPFAAHEHGTFDELVRQALERRSHRRLPPLGVVHRIDKETSGLVIFARTIAAKRHLKQQFRFHTNSRIYLALAHGHVAPKTIRSRIVADRGDGRRGSTRNAALGQLATTHVEVLERFESTTLIRCRLETGRTHQIRIHLAEAGNPLLGERVYARDAALPAPPAPRLMLHAAQLGITHPTSEQRLEFTSELPKDFGCLLKQLRHRD